jgi:diguanylate cyclase (GGDEF)-like protein
MNNPLHSLPGRIVFFVFAATLVTSLTVTAVSVSTIDTFLRTRIDQKFPDVLQSTEEQLDSWYVDRLREIAVFAESEVLEANLTTLKADSHPRRRERALSETEKYVAYVLDSFPQYAALFVLDDEHEVVLWLGEALELSHAMRLELASPEAPSFGHALELAGRPVQIASAPLASSPAGGLGSLHAVLYLDSMIEVLSTSELGPSGQILLIDATGHYITGSGKTPPVEPFVGPLPEEGRQWVLEDYTNEAKERVVGGARRFPRFGWTIVVEQPYNEAFEPVVSTKMRVLVINLGIVLVVCLAALRVAYSITRPIEALSGAAQRISEGDRDFPIPESESSDEVGVLTRAFKVMTDRLTRNALELEQGHEAVEAANEELQRKNDELHRVNEVLEQLSITDGLTKLHNHRHFQEQLVQECKRASRMKRPLSLILVDIDYFKLWNDRLGHAAGDQILRQMAEVMNDVIRETDLLARYGGEEFGLIAPSTDLEGATMLAEKIREAVSSTAFFLAPPSEQEPITVSVGVAGFEGDRRELFNEADRALYRAKSAGRDCVVTAEPGTEPT